MRIAHGHLDIAVTQDALQGEDVSALHHVVAGEDQPSREVVPFAVYWGQRAMALCLK